MSLTIFYDSRCPLCLAEMRELKRYDVKNRLVFEDLHALDFSERYPGIDKTAAMNGLHAQSSSGEMLFGLDVTQRAWSLVGKHAWLAALRWPIIRPIADGAYRLFARHRYRISYWLTGKARCQQCSIEKSRGDF